MAELKPCPWCGRKPKINDLGQVKILSCTYSKCVIQPRIVYTWRPEKEKEAFEAWNRRAYKAAMKIDISEVVNGAIDKIKQEGYTVQKWIPCSERLPEVGVPVLTFDGEYMRVEAHIGWIDADGEKLKGEWWVDGTEGDNYNCVGLRDGTATHWMPLPEPPEKE